MITAVLTTPVSSLTPGSVAAAALISLALSWLAIALFQRTLEATWPALYLLALAAWAVALDHSDPMTRMLVGPWALLALISLVRDSQTLAPHRSLIAGTAAVLSAAALAGVALFRGGDPGLALALTHALQALLLALWRPRPGTGLHSLAWWVLVSGWLSPSEQGWLWPLVLLAHGGLLALAAGLALHHASTARRRHGTRRQESVAVETLRDLRLDLAALRLWSSLPGNRHRPDARRRAGRWSTALEWRIAQLEDDALLAQDRLHRTSEEFDLFTLLRRALEPLRHPGATPFLYAWANPELPRRWHGDAQRLEGLLGELTRRCLAQPLSSTVALAIGDGGSLAGHPALLCRLKIDALAGARLLTPDLRRHITQLGGQCGLRGAGGRGVWLRLPLQPAPIQPLEPAPPLPWRQRVLLVHAHRSYRQALARILRHQHCLVDEASDGPSALARIAASHSGHHRYDWLLFQPPGGTAEARALQHEIAHRWPRSALNLVVLASAEGCIHPPRPLLCNDVPALLSTSAIPAVQPLPLGRHVLVLGGRARLRQALSAALSELGCRVAEGPGGPLARCLKEAPRRHGFAPDALLLAETPDLTAELTRLLQSRPPQSLPQLITLGGEGDDQQAWRKLGIRDILPRVPRLDELARALTRPQPSRRLCSQLPPAPWRDLTASGEPEFPADAPIPWHLLSPD